MTQTVPSQLLAAAVTTFRSLIAIMQEMGNPTNQLGQVASSLGEVATMFERVAMTTATFEQQLNQQTNANSQMQQQINQQAAINNQLNSSNQQTAKQMQDLQKLVQDMQTRAAANPPGKGNNRKPLCESRSVTHLKTLGSKKEDFKNWNERLINATTQVCGPEWRSFVKHLNEKLDLHRKV